MCSVSEKPFICYGELLPLLCLVFRKSVVFLGFQVSVVVRVTCWYIFPSAVLIFFFFLSVCSSPRFVNLFESSKHQAMRNVPLVQLGAEDGPEKRHASNRLVIRGYYY